MQMLNILIIENDLSLCNTYEIALRNVGYQVLLAHDEETVWSLFEKYKIDLIIADIMVPFIDGYDFLTTLREADSHTPVMVTSAHDDFISKSRCFTLGADDYMTKPLDIKEILLRITALFRRANINSRHQLTIGNTALNYDAFTVACGDNTIMLPQKEFLLLYKLISYPGNIFTRIQLMDEIWGRDSQSDAQTVDVHINRLRRRFQNNNDFKIITIRDLGYKAVTVTILPSR